MENKIKVIIRFRNKQTLNIPINKKITKKITKIIDNNEIIINDYIKNININYTFDKIIDENIDNSLLYDEININNYIDSFLKGYNLTIFAYGPTSSGKTYTIHGNNLIDFNTINIESGIIPRIIFNLNEKLNFSVNNIQIKINFIQIYNEKIYDLLKEDNISHKVRWKNNDEFIVEGVYDYFMTSFEDTMFYN